MTPIQTAQNIAIRLFFSNVNGDENDAYNHLYECDNPYTTYIDDHFVGKPFQPWQPFEFRTVADIQEYVENLVNDIFRSTNEPDDGEEVGENAPESSTSDAVECPECHSTTITKKGRDGNRQRFKCKDCGKHFYQ